MNNSYSMYSQLKLDQTRHSQICKYNSNMLTYVKHKQEIPTNSKYLHEQVYLCARCLTFASEDKLETNTVLEINTLLERTI